MPVITRPSDQELAAARTHVAEYGAWFIGIGVLLALLGIVAIALPLLSTIAAVIWIGWTALVCGVLITLPALLGWRWPDSVSELLTGSLYVAVGALILYAPLSSMLSLTVVVALLLVAEGIIGIVAAFTIRPLNGWGWLLSSGLVAIVAGVLVACELPSSATWALGLLFGLNLLSTGLSFIFLALACRRSIQSIVPEPIEHDFGHADAKAS